jgi:hypothetical protein
MFVLDNVISFMLMKIVAGQEIKMTVLCVDKKLVTAEKDMDSIELKKVQEE